MTSISAGIARNRAGSNPRGRVTSSHSNNSTSSSINHQATYSNSHSKEQLIKLQIDIEDRGKVCTIFQNKIDRQRIVLSNIVSEIKGHYQQVLEVRVKRKEDLVYISKFLYGLQFRYLPFLFGFNQPYIWYT